MADTYTFTAANTGTEEAREQVKDLLAQAGLDISNLDGPSLDTAVREITTAIRSGDTDAITVTPAQMAERYNNAMQTINARHFEAQGPLDPEWTQGPGDMSDWLPQGTGSDWIPSVEEQAQIRARDAQERSAEIPGAIEVTFERDGNTIANPRLTIQDPETRAVYEDLSPAQQETAAIAFMKSQNMLIDPNESFVQSVDPVTVNGHTLELIHGTTAMMVGREEFGNIIAEVTGKPTPESLRVAAPARQAAAPAPAVERMSIAVTTGEGSELKQIQQALNEMGIKGANGKPLTEDGLPGGNTEHALRQFEKQTGHDLGESVDAADLTVITQTAGIDIVESTVTPVEPEVAVQDKTPTAGQPSPEEREQLQEQAGDPALGTPEVAHVAAPVIADAPLVKPARAAEVAAEAPAQEPDVSATEKTAESAVEAPVPVAKPQELAAEKAAEAAAEASAAEPETSAADQPSYSYDVRSNFANVSDHERDTVRHVQTMLEDMGHDLDPENRFKDGGKDGMYGQVTDGELKKFAAEHGLDYKGSITPELVASIEGKHAARHVAQSQETTMQGVLDDCGFERGSNDIQYNGEPTAGDGLPAQQAVNTQHHEQQRQSQTAVT